MSNVLNLLERAAELNEDGVYELADGSFGPAVQSFESAVRQMMQVCHQQNSSNQNGSTAASSSSSAPYNNTASAPWKVIQQTQQQQPQHCLLPPCSRSCVEVPFLHDDHFYIYSCTATFNPPSSTAQQHERSQGAVACCSPGEIVFYCATILFNLALAHHQQAKKATTPAEQDASARQALALYQECHSALQQLVVLSSNSNGASACSRDDLVLMNLAVLNNQALILHELAAPITQTQTIFSQLLQQSMYAIQNTHNNFSPFEQSQINEFIRNALVILQPTMAAACA
jgi:hypothetical protein